MVITGEVGTGKTTILNAFLLKLPPRIPKVVIKNPHINPENLYYLLGEAIGMPEEKRSRNYINDLRGQAQGPWAGPCSSWMSPRGSPWRCSRRYGSSPTWRPCNEKLVQIMLLGQQELNEKLNSPQLQAAQADGSASSTTSRPSDSQRDQGLYRSPAPGWRGTSPGKNPCSPSSALAEIYRYTTGFPEAHQHRVRQCAAGCLQR
ncbi:MAG: ATP-binding protein [Desulfosudis oleivorans]|nr:ATP-binding protein [Desulfosudis oleivorans]